MKLQEYQAKELLARYDVPIPKGKVAETTEQVAEAAASLGGRAVVKAQVLAGGRGKAGAVKVAKTTEEAAQFAASILGRKLYFEQAKEELWIDRVYVEEALPIAKEYYIGITTDRGSQRNVFIVSSQGGRMVGVEALLRWDHATRGSIPPATFIPVAEQMGLMGMIGAFVLRRALEEAKRWPEDLYIAVNLSPLQVRDGTIVNLVRSGLAESGVSPSRLVLEITEGVLIDNPDEMVKRIKDLHELGVRVALDDFGSGYSNLGYLQRFPLDKLKIDKSFVWALGKSSNGGVIIQAIVALGRALGLSVLVEGVETEQQRVLLRLAGCDEMQGFLFARPAPAKAIDRLLAQARGGRPPQPEALTA